MAGPPGVESRDSDQINHAGLNQTLTVECEPFGELGAWTQELSVLS